MSSITQAAATLHKTRATLLKKRKTLHQKKQRIEEREDIHTRVGIHEGDAGENEAEIQW